MARYKFYAVLRSTSGEVISYANVSVYIAGTQTPAKVYLTKDAIDYVDQVPQVQSDENGRIEFWVDDNDYLPTTRFYLEITKGTWFASIDDVKIIEEDRVLYIGEDAPASPFAGMVWIDTNYMPARVKFYDGANWVGVSVSESDTVDGYHASQVPSANTVVVSESGGTINDKWLPSTVARKTVSSVTIYVDNVNGSDTTGNGSSSNPYRTFARALQDIGEFFNANVTIVLKASNVSYGTLEVVGITNKQSSINLTISGETAVLDSGTVTGFNNSVNDPVYGSLVQVAQITDNTKNWTTDQWKHKLLRVYKGTTSYYRIITNNDATNLYCSYTFPVAIDNTWSYEILDWGTKVDFIRCYLGYNTGFQFLDVLGSSAGYQVIVRDSGHGININMCRLNAVLGQTNSLLFVNRTFLVMNSSYINHNSVNTTSVVTFLGNGSSLLLRGVIFDNLGHYAIYNHLELTKVFVSYGSRFYRGSSNPVAAIHLLLGTLACDDTTYGKILVDAGATGGIILTRGAIIHASSNFVFGPNVTTSIVSHLGLIDGGRLLVSDYFGVAITNNDYTKLHSRLQVQGSVATQVTTVSANTTLGVNHHIVLVDASGGNRTITLPDATICAGRQYIVKKIDSSTNIVTISAQAGQAIDGQSSVVLNTQYQTVAMVSNGSNWYKIAG